MPTSSKAKREHEASVLRRSQAARHYRELDALINAHQEQRLALEDSLVGYTDGELELNEVARRETLIAELSRRRDAAVEVVG